VLKEKKNKTVKKFRIGQNFDFRSHFGEFFRERRNVKTLFSATSEVFGWWLGRVPAGRLNILTPEFIPGTKREPKNVRGGRKSAIASFFTDERWKDLNPREFWAGIKSRVGLAFDFRSHFGEFVRGGRDAKTLLTATSEVFGLGRAL
jgi:hypothetical protein